MDCDVLDRKKFPVGAILAGPAVIEELSATTLDEPNSVAEVDEIGSIIIRGK